MRRDVQFLRTIDTPYRVVRDRLRDRAGAVLGDAGGEGPIVANLTAHLGGREVVRDMQVEIVTLDEPDGAATGSHLVLRGDASSHPDLFPHLEARFDAVPVSTDRTALFFVASYRPPLGLVGKALDSAGLHHFAEESLRGYFDRIGDRLAAAAAPEMP